MNEAHIRERIAALDAQIKKAREVGMSKVYIARLVREANQLEAKLK